TGSIKRHGTALIYMTVGMVIFAGVVSLGVDVAHVRIVKSQLQCAADAAARAACQNLPNGVSAAQNAAVDIASKNYADGKPVVLNPNTDVIFGIWDPKAKTFTQLNGAARSGANAVTVIPVRNNSHNNRVNLTFAGVVGKSSCDVSASATSCLTGNAGNYSIIGINGITMGLSAFTDSYNSSQTTYSAASAHQNGSIASNGNISLSGTVLVKGDCRCGAEMTTSLSGSASVTGLNAPLGTVLSYPSVTLPGSYQDLGDVNMSSGTSSVPGGTYLIHNLVLSGTAHIIWTGPTVLYIRDSYNVSGSAQIDTYQNIPANRILYFLPSCSTATWTGTNVCVGELYGPDTDFTVSGGVELMGRITARTINNSSSGGMHYDEALMPPGGTAARSAVSTEQ